MDDSLFSNTGEISGHTLLKLVSQDLPKFSTPLPIVQPKKKTTRRRHHAFPSPRPSIDPNLTPKTLLKNVVKEQIARKSMPSFPKEDEIFQFQHEKTRSRRSSRALPELYETSVEESEITEERSLLPDIADISVIESGPKKRKLQLGKLGKSQPFMNFQKTRSQANAKHLPGPLSTQSSSRTASVRRKQNTSQIISDSSFSDLDCPSDINLNTKVVKGSPSSVKQKPFSEKEMPQLLSDSEASLISSGKLNLQQKSRTSSSSKRKSNKLSVSLPLFSERISATASSEKNSLSNVHQSSTRPRLSDKNISSNSSQFQEPDGAAFTEVRSQTRNITMASKPTGFYEPSDADVESSDEEETGIHNQNMSVADAINQLSESHERNALAVESMSRISQSEHHERGVTSRSLPHSTLQVSSHSPLVESEEEISVEKIIACNVAVHSVKKSKTEKRTSLSSKSVSRISLSGHPEEGLSSRSLNHSKRVSLRASPGSDEEGSDEESSNDQRIGRNAAVQPVKRPVRTSHKSMSRISQPELPEKGLASKSLNHSKQVSLHAPPSGSDEEASNDQNIDCNASVQPLKKSNRTSHKSVSRISRPELQEEGLTPRSLNHSKQVSLHVSASSSDKLHAPPSGSDEEASNDQNIDCNAAVQPLKKSDRTSRKSVSRISWPGLQEEGLTLRSLNHSKQVSLHSPPFGADEETSSDQNFDSNAVVQPVKKPKMSERTYRESIPRISQSEHPEESLTSRSLNHSKRVSLHAHLSGSDEEATDDQDNDCNAAVQPVKEPKASERAARKSMSRISQSEHPKEGLTSKSLNCSKQVSLHAPLSSPDEEASNDPNIALNFGVQSARKSKSRKSSFRQQKSVSQVSMSEHSLKSVASLLGDVNNQENGDVTPHDFEVSVPAVQQEHEISLQKSQRAFRRAGYSKEEIELPQNISPVKTPSKLHEAVSLTQNKSVLPKISSQNSTAAPPASPQVNNERTDLKCGSHVTQDVAPGTVERDKGKSISKYRSRKPKTTILRLPKSVSRISVSQRDDTKSSSYFINPPNISMHGTPQVFEDASYVGPHKARVPDKKTSKSLRKSDHPKKASESGTSTSSTLCTTAGDTSSVKQKMHSTAIQDNNETVNTVQDGSISISPIKRKIQKKSLSGKYRMLSTADWNDDDDEKFEHSAGKSDECDESADDVHAEELPLPPGVQNHDQEHMSEEGVEAPSASRVQKKRQAKKSRIPRISALDTKNFVERFAGMKISKGALNTIMESCDIFWENTFEALQAYAKHAKRQTIDVEDVELLLYRQRLVHDRSSINALIAQYMPMELRSKLIPMAVPKIAIP